MELMQLLSFNEIVSTGSFSKASEKVFRSQSAISHQIKNLEAELCVRLFKRLGKRTVLTEEGEMLFSLADKFFGDLDNLKRVYADMRQGIAGNLKIAASSPIVTYLLPGVIRSFVNRFPRINLRLTTCQYTSEIISLILSGEYDFGIGIDFLQELPEKKIAFSFWKSFDSCLIVPKDHLLSRRRTVNLADLAGYPHILYREGAIRRTVEKVYAQSGYKVNIKMEVDTAENLRTYVDMGIGVGIITFLTVTKQDKKRFTIINTRHIFDKVDAGIYYAKGKYISLPALQFIKSVSPELSDKLASSR